MSHSRRTPTTLMIAALVVAACGGDGATPTTDTAPTTTAASPTTTATPPTTTEAPGTTEAPATTVAPEGLIRFSSGQYSFAVYYPEDWDGDTSEEGAVLVVTAPTIATELFPVAFRVSVTDKAAGLSLSDYVDASYTGLEQAIPGFTFFSEGTGTIDGVDGEFLYYGGAFEDFDMEFMQVFTIYDGLAYIITYTGAAADFVTYTDTFTDFLDSWEWID